MSENNGTADGPDNVQETGSSSQTDNARRRLWMGGGALLLALIGIAAISLFVVIDPFGWVDRIFGGGDKVAHMVPEDTSMYFSVDLLKTTTSIGLDDIVKTFVGAGGGDTDETSGVVDWLDNLLNEKYGFSFTEDIQPWVGQYVGVAYSGAGYPEMGALDDGDFSVTILEIRNTGGAEDFMHSYMAAVEENQYGEGSFSESEYEGVTIHVLDSGFDVQSAVARVGKYLVFSSSVESIQKVIDTRGANSLADSTVYQDVIGKLPRTRFATAFIDLKQFQDMASSLNTMGVSSSINADYSFYAMGFSIELAEQGILVEAVQSIDEGSLESDQLRTLQAVPVRSDADKLLPPETFMYMAAKGESASEGERRTVMDNMLQNEDYTEALELFSEQYGLDLTDIMGAITGEVVMAMMPSDTGMFASMAQMPMGILLMIGTDDENTVYEAIQSINESVMADPFSEYTIEDTSYDDLRLFTVGVENPFIGGSVPLMTYGVGEGYILLASGIDVIEDTFDGGPSLADEEAYQNVWAALPSGTIPYFFLDVHGTLDTLTSGLMGLSASGPTSEIDAVKPLHYILMGMESREQDFPTLKIMFIIEDDSAN